MNAEIELKIGNPPYLHQEESIVKRTAARLAYPGTAQARLPESIRRSVLQSI